MYYTDDQQKAIDHREGNLLILACAGSGKTEVVSRRIAMLVKEGVPKNAIVAFTFTERAAAELKARIRQHLEELQPDDPALADMYVSTIHSFCLQLLKEIEPNYRKYEVMDEIRQAALIMTRFHHFPDSDRHLGLSRLRSRTRTSGYWETVRTFVNTLNIIHQNGIAIEAIPDDVVRHALEQYEKIAYGYPNYFFDFNRIISELINTLENTPEELERLRNRFQYLVVDEYQDVDDQQERLIGLLTETGRRVHVTAVGDDDQAIYGWRGAKIENILKFKQRYPDVEEIKLVYNFRSTHVIVDIANRALRKLPQDSRVTKDMEARHWDETGSDLVETMAERADVQLRAFESDLEEAAWVADRIKQLRGTIIREKDNTERAIDYADMAILLRSVRTSGQIFASELQDQQIPVVVKGIGGLFDHDEVLLIQAAFCLLARTDFVLNVDNGHRRLDEPQIRDFVRIKIRKLRDGRGAILGANEAKFLEWIAAKREELDQRNLEKERRGRLARRIYPQGIFHEMLQELGAAEGTEPWPQDVLFNLGRLSKLITQFEAVHQWVTPNQLTSLCMFLGGWAAGQVDEGGLDESGTPNAVQIMTVHGAKGLEWPVVFVPRVSSSNFPSNFRNRGPETFLDAQTFTPKEYASGDDGERRLWYVALTRCGKFLNISSQNRKRKRPTVFFKEINHDYVQKDGPITDRPKADPTPPTNVELLPTTFTALNYYWRCPFEYQLRSLMGFEPGVTEPYGYGQQIHNVLAEVHKRALNGKVLSVDEVMELVDKRFHLRYTRDGDIYQPLSSLRDAAKDSLKRYFEAYPDTAKFVLEAEKPFEFVDKESGALISGTVDLLQRIDHASSGEVLRRPVAVVDFKTHRWKDKATFLRNKAEVETQLRLYAVAVRSALGFEAFAARAHFLSPKPPSEEWVSEMITVDVSQDKQEGVRKKVREGVDGIQGSIASGKFDLKGHQTGQCPHCDFRTFCPGYTKWRREDTATPNPPSPEESSSDEMRLVMEDIDAGQTTE